MTARGIATALLLAALFTPIAEAQVRIDGLAGAGSALVDGIDAAPINPARLAVRGGPRMRLIDSFGATSNNSFDLSDYNRYNGATLTEADEQEILAKIDGDHLEADGIVRAIGPAFRFGRWAAVIRTHGDADLGLPKDGLRLLLEGNTPDETFHVADFRGTGTFASALSISHGRWVDVPRAGRWAVGGTIHWIQGWARARVLEGSGTITTERAGINGEGSFLLRTATGGSGFGLDLACWRPIAERWSIALVLHDLFSAVHWTRGTELRHVRFRLQESTAEEISEGEDLLETEEETTPTGSFRSTLPPRLNVGVAHERGRWTMAADWTQGFEHSLTTTTTPRVAIGAERRFPFGITTRAGVSIGGLDRRSAALGLGFSPGPVRIDLALTARDGSLPFTGNGIGAGIALGAAF
ncbi:MAG: hypothetical protein GF346_03745 [Candidatus Eisenbacteria bacterium]|nr:hypothetical protein [Candidatus Latescibacterota bacterium]MBD3301537.1 hypothetical protein [Candidatus Eisenbacteria bacterium]